LGRLDEAAAYEEGIKRAEKLNDRRQVAVNTSQLGTVRMLQNRYCEALDIYTKARDTFAALGEPRQVATIWHQIGMVHQEAGQFEPAEQAYRQSLAILVRESDLDGQASSLGQLGNLYDAMGRLEEAVTFYRQCAEVRVHLQDFAGEGRVRNNLADTLIKLRRYDEARQELRRAIERKKPYGHSAEPWKAWAILESLERATSHAMAAEAARQQAIEPYLAYRRAGGVSQSPATQFFDLVAQVIQQNTADEARQLLSQIASQPNVPTFVKALISKLQSLLAGDRNHALATDPKLICLDAAELLLLLEKL